MKRVFKPVKVIDIRIDGGTQSREDIDPHWVHEMVDNMKNDVEYPAVEARFDGVHYWLTDGFHRYHAYTQLGIKQIEVAYLPGTQFDAQVDSYGANDKHGKPRSRADKVKAVKSALENPQVKDKSNYAIAQICKVSAPFVASVINPKQKEKQAEARKRHTIKKANEIKAEEVDENKVLSNQITKEKPLEVPVGGEAPDEAELLANQKKQEADMEMVANLLDADDKLKHLYDENKKLTHQIVILELRVKELMNEKNAAIKIAKDLQKQIDKAKAKK